MTRYRWVWRDAEKSERLFAVGILLDGSLYNPNSYPEDIVRAAVLAANACRHERRSAAAQKAAETRRERQKAKVHHIARRVAANQNCGPRHRCYVCGRKLDDPQSIARGIGSECWQDVLSTIASIQRNSEGGA
jgi:Family of unknown function (DUF6011)